MELASTNRSASQKEELCRLREESAANKARLELLQVSLSGKWLLIPKFHCAPCFEKGWPQSLVASALLRADDVDLGAGLWTKMSISTAGDARLLEEQLFQAKTALAGAHKEVNELQLRQASLDKAKSEVDKELATLRTELSIHANWKHEFHEQHGQVEHLTALPLPCTCLFLTANPKCCTGLGHETLV